MTNTYLIGGANDKVFRSSNLTTWQASNTLGGDVRSIASNEDGSEIVALIWNINPSGSPIAKSTDGGVTFNYVFLAPPYNDPYVWFFDIIYGNGKFLILFNGNMLIMSVGSNTITPYTDSSSINAICFDGTQFSIALNDRIRVSLDAITWTTVGNIGLPNFNNGNIKSLASNGSGTWVIRGNDTVNNTYVSVDNAMTWQPKGKPSDASSDFCFVIYKAPHFLAAGTSPDDAGRFAYSVDGLTWTTINTTTLSLNVSNISHDGTNVIISGFTENGSNYAYASNMNGPFTYGNIGDTFGAFKATFYTSQQTAQCDTPSFDPVSGVYGSIQNIQIFCSNATDIFYTTDGTEPTAISTRYTTPLDVSTTTTIKAIGMRSGYTNSIIATATYEILYCESPIFSILSGTYFTNQTLELTCSTTGSRIYFTVDGSDPTTSSTEYNSSILLDGNKTIKAFAVANGYMNSSVVSETYIFQCSNVSFLPVEGTYTSSQNIQILCGTPLVDMRYTDDGSQPLVTSSLYTTPIFLNTTKTLKAKAFKTNYNSSSVETGIFTINLPQVNTPTFNPVSGTYSGNQTINISCGTSGVDIFYTVDGSTPTVLSTPYTSAINVIENTVIKAIAVKNDFIDSNVAIADYNIQTIDPVFSPNSGKYTSANVTISCSTPKSRVFYTIDGSTPTIQSIEYIKAIVLHEGITKIKAIAVTQNLTDSKVVEASFLIEGSKTTTKYIEPNQSGFSKPEVLPWEV